MSSPLKQLLAESKGLPSAFRRDHPIGTVWAGKVVRVDVRQVRDDDGQPDTWDNGDPKQQVIVAIQTDQRDPERPGDDGVRGIYIKWWGEQRKALREALETAGAEDIEIGGMFAAQYVGDGEQPKNKMFSPPKLMRYEYKAPSPTAGLLSGGNGKAPAAAAPAAQPKPDVWDEPAKDDGLEEFAPTVTTTAPPTPPPAAPAPAAPPAAAAPASNGAPADPVALLATVKAYIALQMSDEQIVAVTGAPAPAVAAIRNLPS